LKKPLSCICPLLSPELISLEETEASGKKNLIYMKTKLHNLSSRHRFIPYVLNAFGFLLSLMFVLMIIIILNVAALGSY